MHNKLGVYVLCLSYLWFDWLILAILLILLFFYSVFHNTCLKLSYVNLNTLNYETNLYYISNKVSKTYFKQSTPKID